MKKNITFLFLLLGIAVFAQSNNSVELLAKYTFENNLVNEVNTSVVGELLAQSNGTLPVFEQNEERSGTVLRQYFGFNDASSISYVRFPNPLQGTDFAGASVSLWINRIDANVWDGIWSFFDEDNSDGIDGRFYLTPNAYLGFNGTGGWFDCNWPENVTNAISVGEWNMVTVTADAQGFHIYINGQLRYDIATQVAWNSIDAVAPTDFPYQSVVNLINSAANFYLGYGSWWGSLDILVDDLLIYKGVLSDMEVASLYNSYTGIKNPVSAREINLSYSQQGNSLYIRGLTGNEKIELLNLTGQSVYAGHRTMIATDNLNRGVYLLKVSAGNTTKIQKIMIR